MREAVLLYETPNRAITHGTVFSAVNPGIPRHQDIVLTFEEQLEHGLLAAV
jgi:hypothetical protein